MRIAETVCSAMALFSPLKMKQVRRVLPRVSPHWVGDGFYVYPIFAELAFTNEVSPFLMFDYGQPKQFEPTTKQRGVGEHPHRGMETVTIALQGEIEHGDSIGNRGVIGPGEVQWMTAGHGIIHEEFHSSNFKKTGGIMEMCQIWVNLPSKDKLTPPKYQPIMNEDMPQVPLDDDAGWVRVIAGDFNGTKGRASTFSPINLWHVNLKADKTVNLKTIQGHNSIVFCRSGSVQVGDSTETMKPAQIALLSYDGDGIQLRTQSEEAVLMILDGQPLNEPIAARGPFVMNTESELRQAMMDYQNGKMGRGIKG